MDQISQTNQINQMDSLEEALEGLIRAIKESKEYVRYQKIRAEVKERPQLEQQIHAFRKKNYEIQNSVNEVDLYDRMDGLEREGAQFRREPLVNEYLDAELAFCRQFQKINWEIVRNIDFDLGFTFDY